MSQTKKKIKYLPKQVVNGVSLSGQEHQAIKLIGQGFSVSEVVARLQVTPHCIGDIKQRLREKLGLRSSAELAAYATKEQIKQEIKDGDFLRDDILAEWLCWKMWQGPIEPASVLDLILEFRQLSPTEAWKQLKQARPDLRIRRP